MQTTPREWNDLCKAMKVDHVICIDPDEQTQGEVGEIQFVISLAEAKALYPGMDWVFCGMHEGAAELGKFTHPESAMYVFGGDREGFKAEADAETSWLFVPTEGKELWSGQAAGMILWDR